MPTDIAVGRRKDNITPGNYIKKNLATNIPITIKAVIKIRIITSRFI